MERARTSSETSPGRSSREPRVLRVGAFIVDAMATPERHLQRLVELAPWFTPRRIDAYLLPMITKRDRVSLRALDWFVTKYCKSSPILVGGSDGIHCVFTLYRVWLKQWRRDLFDPFRRSARVSFFGRDEVRYETTCAQLNFLHWAEAHGVRRQAELRIASVEREMLAALGRKRARGARDHCGCPGRDGSERRNRRRTARPQDPQERCQVFLLRDAPLRLDLSPRVAV